MLLGSHWPILSGYEAQDALQYARDSADAERRGQALITLALLRDQAGYFAEALSLLDTSNAYDAAASAYFRFAKVLEEPSEIQQSLRATKKAYEHQRLESRGDVE